MSKNRSKTDGILIAAIVISYIIYSVFWMRAALVQVNLDKTTATELIEQFTKESMIRNICELCVYILFLIRCWNTWDGAVERRCVTYLLETSKIILSVLVLGGIFTAIQYFMIGLFWGNYLMPVVILMGITVAMLLLTSGIQAKTDITKEKY